jgi:non-haem Fe2+, alpha-ketoglutarate-dependent halogenase
MPMPGAADPADIQAWVIGVCRDLGLRLSDPDDDFFAAGGTSLTAIKFLGQVEQDFGENTLPVEDLFERSTVREIAACIQQNRSRTMSSSEP